MTQQTILLTHNWEPSQAKPCHQTLTLLNVKLVQQGKKQGKSSLNYMPQWKLQTKHWTAAIMKTPGQQRLTTMKEALNDPKCKNNLLEGWMGRRPGKGEWQQEHWYITNKHMTIKTSHTLAHTLPNCVWETCFFFTSFVPQPVENNTLSLLTGASLGQIMECPLT